MMPGDGWSYSYKNNKSSGAARCKNYPYHCYDCKRIQEDAERCMEAGMNAHLAKPLDDEKIKQTISEELRKQNACHE